MNIGVLRVGIRLFHTDEPDPSNSLPKAHPRFQRVPGAEPWSGGEALEAESFLRIRHPIEGTNWLHVRVLNERNCT